MYCALEWLEYTHIFSINMYAEGYIYVYIYNRCLLNSVEKHPFFASWQTFGGFDRKRRNLYMYVMYRGPCYALLPHGLLFGSRSAMEGSEEERDGEGGNNVKHKKQTQYKRRSMLWMCIFFGEILYIWMHTQLYRSTLEFFAES